MKRSRLPFGLLCLLALFSARAEAAVDDVYLGTGSRGSVAIGGTEPRIVNDYAQVTAPLAPGDTVIPLEMSHLNFTIPILSRLALVLQTTGIVPEPASGGSSSIDLADTNVGRWEFVRIASIPANNTLELTQPLVNNYAAGISQVVFVPEYQSLTINSGASIVAAPWNGSTGGVIAFLVSGTLTNNGRIDATGTGFRGGTAETDSSGTIGCAGLDEPVPQGARKGEGIAITRYGPTQGGNGRVANAAGGGVCYAAGGGGGANGGSGGSGGHSHGLLDDGRPVGGQGGGALTTAGTTSRLLLGGGGGAGHMHEGGDTGGSGGRGGGIVFVRAGTLNNAGSVLANGQSGGAVTEGGVGGAGAGGTVLLRAGNVFPTCGQVRAIGGDGGVTGQAQAGPGGGGGGGRIVLQGSGCGSTGVSTGGNAGQQPDPLSPGGLAHGATSGSAGLRTLLAGTYQQLETPLILSPSEGATVASTSPTFNGLLSAAPAGTTVTVWIDGVLYGTAPVIGGQFSVTSTVGLANGPHVLTARAFRDTDAGSISSRNFTVDVAPPPAPIVQTPAHGSATNDSTPTISGTAEPQATVTVIVDGSTLGHTNADGSGHWTIIPDAPLVDGLHTVRATATDNAGNTGPTSGTNDFTIDTQPPDAPVIATPANGSTGNDTTPTYEGSAEPDATVTVTVNGAIRGAISVSGSGHWTFTDSVPLSDGPHTVRARAMDAVGNVSGDSLGHTFIIDTQPPPPPVVIAPADGAFGNDDTPTYSGTAEAGAQVQVTVDGAVLGAASTNGANDWTFTTPLPLADGPHTIEARAIDAAGNTGDPSASHTFTVDTTAPPVPLISSPAEGETLDTATPTFAGSAEPRASVALHIDAIEIGSVDADASGHWSLAVTTPLQDGPHAAAATATDAAGNTGATSATRSFFIATDVTVTPSAGSGGTITPDTPQTVARGETIAFTVTPDTGFIASVAGSCGGELADTVYTTLALTTDCTVIAGFERNPPGMIDLGTPAPVLDADEGNGGTRTLVIPLLLGTVTADAVQLAYTLAPATGSAGDVASDFASPATGTVTFAAGTQDATLSLEIVADDVVEPDEAFLLILEVLSRLPDDSAPNAVLAPSVAAGIPVVLRNDDDATLRFADISRSEDAGIVALVATLDRPVQGGLAVDYASSDGTATAGSDYTAVSGMFTHDGEVTTTSQIDVTLLDDARFEPHEIFSLNFGAVTCAVAPCPVAVTGGTVTILDDEAPAQGLSIAVDNGIDGMVHTGTISTYRVTVRNRGPGAADGVAVGDELPALSLLEPLWTCAINRGGSCAPAVGRGALSATTPLLSMPEGSEAILELDARVGPFDPTLDYRVLLTPPAGYADLDTSDNTSIDSDVGPTIFRSDFERQ